MVSIAICEATQVTRCHSALVQSTLSPKNKKLITKSSTEAELVGIDDVLPRALWTKYFMEAQSYGVTTVLNEDNQSTIKLSENGKASSGKGTRPINIRYFFNTEVPIQYCPTKQMVANYFTKPLQCVLFYKFRDQIMGVVPMDTITGDHRSVLDDESDDPSSPKKTIARPQRAHTSNKATTHQSWSDVVKSKPSDGSDGPLRPILVNRSPIFSL
jgi:hypothetical protein